MLVLSFSAHESAVLGDSVLVSIARVSGNRVRIALQGPLTFVRKELQRNAPSEPSGKQGCLVLTRRIDESVVLGDIGSVTVVKTRGGRATLGFEVDRSVRILRKKVYEQEFGAFTKYREPWN